MSLSLALNTALSGLNVNQQALAVLSQNIANANTPGYSRKIINLRAQSTDGNGSGVSIDSITRRVNEFLIQSIRSQNSVSGRASIINDFSGRTQLMLGNPGANNSLNAYATGFFNTMQSLAQTPEDTSLKASTISNAVTMARHISDLAGNLQDLRFQADQSISSSITTINGNLKQIYNLNSIITQNISLGKPVTEQQDQRDMLLKDIANYMNIETFNRPDGAINVSCAAAVLVDEGLYQLAYTPAASASALANDTPLAPILAYRLDSDGNPSGAGTTLVSGGTSSQVVGSITSGQIKGLLDLRDKQLSSMLQQLDTFAVTLRDKVNAVHNAGTSYPGTNALTGMREVSPQETTEWTGRMRLAILGASGQPVLAGYSGQMLTPMTLDLGSLDTGNGPGQPSVQGIINEINQYYGIPQNKAQVGNLNNIQLASDVRSLPGSPPIFKFDLDLENLSATTSHVYVTGVSVLDDTSAAMTVTQSPSSIDIDGSNSFVTSNGSGIVTINTDGAHGLANGDNILLPDLATLTTAVNPAADINGIPLTELAGKTFTISNVTSTSFQITATSSASASGNVDAVGGTFMPEYSEVAAGQSKRTTADGMIITSLAANQTSAYYTVTVDVTVDDGDGNITTSQVTYRVDNSQSNLLNKRYAATGVTDDGELLLPTSNQTLARAILVDENGVELPRINGQYPSTRSGFLKILATNSAYTVAIDSLDSADQGNADSSIAATSRGFSHYFGLNNFFDDDGDPAIAGSAINLRVTQRLIDNPNLISTSTLSQSRSSADDPVYTYEHNIGDNDIIQQMYSLGLATTTFAAAGGLGATVQTFSGYASQIISTAAVNALSAKNDDVNAQTLLNGYDQQENSISGVNLDQELGNTVIYQNAYAASARVVTVANTLFDALLQAFNS